jgi:hypothetical protein
MTCDQCGGSDQVVATQDGRRCRHCYRGYKAGKSVGRAVLSDNSTPLPQVVTCGNCGSRIMLGGPYTQCHVCGSHLNPDGSVLRVGGHDNC